MKNNCLWACNSPIFLCIGFAQNIAGNYSCCCAHFPGTFIQTSHSRVLVTTTTMITVTTLTTNFSCTTSSDSFARDARNFAGSATLIAVCPNCSYVCVFFRRVRKNCEKRLLASSCLPVCPSAWNNSTPTGRILIKLDIWDFLKMCREKFKFH